MALPRSGPSGLVLGIAAVLAGLILFSLLDSRRRSPSAPEIAARGPAGAMPSSPPPLYLPPPPVKPTGEAAPAAPAPPPAPAPARIVYVPQPYPVPTPPAAPEAPPPLPPRTTTDPALVVDASVARAATAAPGAEGEAAAGNSAPSSGGRARAGMFANRATTVPQGTLVPAVLETALDSTRPGFARAIVSRDVRGFDGSRVLIPRGSRLIGEYRSEAAPGQRRALVNWTRLIRPDGVTMAIGSPAGDPLGRGGIRARVNSHFLERFAGAILQSALDIGVNLAGRAGGSTVVVLPGAVQGGTAQIVPPSQVTPTLTVRQGTRVSIFVARDLDFTGVENRR